jgi:hypothetical protein
VNGVLAGERTRSIVRPNGAVLATAAAVVLLAVAVPLAVHEGRAHRGPDATVAPSSAATVPGPKARLFIEDLAGTGATFYLTRVRIEAADGTPLGGYPLPTHPPAGAFSVSADGTRIAYLAADGLHVANAIDGTQDHVVHALPLDPSRPNPATEAAQLPFANWARGSTINWSANGNSFAVAWQGCLWTLASDGSALPELARNATSTPVEGAGGVVGATWAPSSNQLLVSVYGSATLLNDATQQPFASDASTGSGIATAIVAANGTSYLPLAGQVCAWYWSAGGRVVGWNPAGTALVTIAAAGGNSHTVAAFPADGTVSVAPDGMHVAGIGPDGIVNVWPIDGGPGTTVRTAVVQDSVQQQLEWLDTQQLILSTTGPDGTTHLTIIDGTGDTHVLPDLHPSAAGGYLVIDARPVG